MAASEERGWRHTASWRLRVRHHRCTASSVPLLIPLRFQTDSDATQRLCAAAVSGPTSRFVHSKSGTADRTGRGEGGDDSRSGRGVSNAASDDIRTS